MQNFVEWMTDSTEFSNIKAIQFSNILDEFICFILINIMIVLYMMMSVTTTESDFGL